MYRAGGFCGVPAPTPALLPVQTGGVGAGAGAAIIAIAILILIALAVIF
ncbi:hypothetical protein Sgly_0467 [Syntrophobotulus glycolicus DSM 8271]|uniref:Uncharacterized protein n=1 Tax=Syntrophobotulus glycolicus (strain DSM 8271 / FlGlyR) TaxID=645991 RepID=F0SYN1_SYNGF|nr:hypothetical protein [Syntrophobotulus glycolicus]ADY54832.1 hypothetical protein Sgly_0467 [Syntrophobotulus glycolicus DSM 8271]